jgi:hypothetical protein
MTAAAKRVERPERARHQVGLIITAEMKQTLERMAEESGRTQSQVAEWLMDRCIHYDRMLNVMNVSMEHIRSGNLERALREEGYTPVHSPYGNIWYPRDYPLGARTGFTPPEGGPK